MRLAALAAAWLGWLLCGAALARADGSLPPQPYRYLHPPAALAGTNRPPLSGVHVLPAGYMRAVKWLTFTTDTQAGISGPKGAFALGPGATAVVIRVAPVETPPGLSSQVVADGNSYSITAVEQPGNKPVTLAKPVDITLLWPYIPIGMEEYRDGTWRQICNQDQAVLTASTVGCSTSTLGTFVAIASPRTAGIHLLVTPASSSRFAWINRFIPVLAALGVVILAAVMGYIVSRPDKKKSQP